MIFFTLFWNFVTWIFGYLAYIAPYQQRWLCQYGKVGTAKIIEKTTSKDSYNNITYYVEYEFSAQYEISSVRETIKRKTSIPEEKWHITEIGMNSTILYDPKKPKKHCYYAGCIYEAVV